MVATDSAAMEVIMNLTRIHRLRESLRTIVWEMLVKRVTQGSDSNIKHTETRDGNSRVDSCA